MLLFVNGTLMRGLELHPNLRGAPLVRETRTAPRYRVFSIGDVHPGMYEDASAGVAVAGELYELDQDTLDHVVANEPDGLYVGEVTLEDGSVVPGVLCTPDLAAGQREISSYGGWRAYLAGTGA
ncbi:MAG: gamma-glutamylcyclotransferase [Nocardioidaceae bacterium]|nr:gamma-glutamylcyclotransferase [Nocardioidaceae bacterium]